MVWGMGGLRELLTNGINWLKRRWRHGFPWLRAGFLVLVCGLIGLLFTPIPAKVKRGLRGLMAPKTVIIPADEKAIRRQIESLLRAEMEEAMERELAAMRKAELATAPQEKPDKDDAPPPALANVPGSVTDVRQLRSGIPFKTEIKLEQGGMASKERVDAASYSAFYQLSLRVPVPAKTITDLEASNAKLSKLLPGLPALVAKAEVSAWYQKMYDNKGARIRRDATALNELLTKHNYYDCETMLNLRAENGRRVFLMQADMDVVSDGSDGDRLPVMPDAIVDSANYQPFTSYGWPKQGAVPNPMVAGWERRIKGADKELAERATSAERKKWLRVRIADLKRGVADLKSRSFLIAEHDPFIVIPVTILAAQNDQFAPKVGDFAVVIHEDKLYPALVGDGGPAFKVGEASLRMAHQINPRALSNNRPVSDLKVSYVIFPGSREAERGPPDYAKWRQRCYELLNEIGGIGPGYSLFEWPNTLPKPVLPPVVTPQAGTATNPAVPNPAAPTPAAPTPVAPTPAAPTPAAPTPAAPTPAAPNPAVPNPAVPNPAVPNPAVPNPAVPNPAAPTG